VRDATPEGFAEYWAAGGGREWSASWFAARLGQASGAFGTAIVRPDELTEEGDVERWKKALRQAAAEWRAP
jgi:hypothetical protein